MEEENKNIKNEIIKKNMANKEPKYVYTLTNPSFREDWLKTGKNSRPVDVRSIMWTFSPSIMNCGMKYRT